MSDREELIALRRMAELEAKASGETAVSPAQTFSEPTTAESIAANPLTRFALGAASPFLGAAEWLPGRAGEVIAENNKELQRLIEAGKEGQSGEMKFAGGAADVAGTVMSPAFLKLMKMFPAAKGYGELAKQGAVTGGIAGATTPTGESDIGTKATATGVGAAAGGMLTPVVSAGIRGVSNLIMPALSGASAETAAGKLAVKAAGDRAPAVAAALRAQQPGETAAQAAQPAGSSEFSALQALLKGHKGTEFGDIARLEEAKRLAALKGITPDMAQAEAARELAGKKNYAAAFKQSAKADVELAQLASNPYFKTAQRESLDLIESKGVDFKSAPIEYLHNVKLGLDKMLQRRGDTALGSGEAKEVAKLKSQLVNWIEKKSSAYEFARREHARLSEPINQAKVLEKMAGVLEKPTGGERANPFLTALGTGEDALIKKATGMPRYVTGDLQKVLTPKQFAVVDDIATKLKSNAVLSERETEGMKGALKAIRASESKDVRLPALVNYKIGIINSLLNRLEGIGGERIEQKTAELMLPGRGPRLGAKMQEAIDHPLGMFGGAGRVQGSVVSPALNEVYQNRMLSGGRQ